jgi:hypothetical protein
VLAGGLCFFGGIEHRRTHRSALRVHSSTQVGSWSQAREQSV